MTFAGANASLEGREIRGGEIIQSGAADASCGHRRRRNVVRCFVLAVDGAVMVNGDRLAESERFAECVDCGQLVSRI